ncbi:hypothetical protein SGPA1_20974 [Streptomyces misionensis JCM 4497]
MRRTGRRRAPAAVGDPHQRGAARRGPGGPAAVPYRHGADRGGRRPQPAAPPAPARHRGRRVRPGPVPGPHPRRQLGRAPDGRGEDHLVHPEGVSGRDQGRPALCRTRSPRGRWTGAPERRLSRTRPADVPAPAGQGAGRPGRVHQAGASRGPPGQLLPRRGFLRAAAHLGRLGAGARHRRRRGRLRGGRVRRRDPLRLERGRHRPRPSAGRRGHPRAVPRRRTGLLDAGPRRRARPDRVRGGHRPGTQGCVTASAPAGGPPPVSGPSSRRPGPGTCR